MNKPKKAVFYLRLTSFILVVAGVAMGLMSVSGIVPYQPAVILVLVSLALAVMSLEQIKGYSFTAWVLVCVGTAMLYPQAFVQWGDFKLEWLIIPLTQLIMFGMGTTLSLSDFTRVVKSPWPVMLGVFLQFSIMPLTGYVIAKSLGFEGEIAAGIVLIGSCSGGVASNLMAYLAGGNVALSVTMTFFSTLIAPLATPLLMKSLAGTFVPIDAVKMMISILNMIIIPVIAGLVAHEILYSQKAWSRQIGKLMLVVMSAVFLAAVSLFLGPERLGPLFSGILLASVLVALISLAKLIIGIILKRSNDWMDTLLPFISMAGICMVLMIIIAQTYEVLIAVGMLLLLAAILHNGIGYALGYWGSKGFGYLMGKMMFRMGKSSDSRSTITESESRTIAIEVGMQNGGMASGLAIEVLQSYFAALPPNVFGTWMNISGSILANYWKQRPIQTDKREALDKEQMVYARKT